MREWNKEQEMISVRRVWRWVPILPRFTPVRLTKITMTIPPDDAAANMLRSVYEKS
jgi:hypothetical protein